MAIEKPFPLSTLFSISLNYRTGTTDELWCMILSGWSQHRHQYKRYSKVVHAYSLMLCFNSLRPRQNGHHLSDGIFKCSCMELVYADPNFTERCCHWSGHQQPNTELCFDEFKTRVYFYALARLQPMREDVKHYYIIPFLIDHDVVNYW